MKKEQYYFLGKITRTHGLHGNVILKLDTDQPEFYNKLEGIFVEINGLLVPFFVDKQQWSRDNSKIISFKNVPLEMAEQTVNKNVFLPLSTLPLLQGKQFYYHEVIGYMIKDEQGNSAGYIESVNDDAPQHYFVLNLEAKQVLIPMVKDWILDVNRDTKIITMSLPEGLLDVFLKTSANSGL